MSGELKLTLISHLRVNLNRATTDFAVFYVVLFGDRAVDKQRERLTAVGAGDRVFFEWMNHSGPPDIGLDHSAIVSQLKRQDQRLKRKR